MAGASGIRAGKAFIEVFLDSSKVQAGLRQIGTKFRSAGGSFQKTGGALLAGAAGLGAPLAFSAKKFADFEDQVAATGAVTGASEGDLKRLAEQAKELGRTTSSTASEVAALQTELGRAGFNPEEILKATPAIRDLANATQTDLAESALIAGSALRGFGLDASEAGRVADVLTLTANRSATTLTDLGEGMKMVAPIAASAGASIEDTAAAMGILANNGLRGTMAGTALARAYKNLANESKANELLEKTGVSAVDAAGNLRPLSDILAELGDATQGMGSAQRLDIFESLFGRGSTAALKLSESGAQFRSLRDELMNAQGAAATTSAKMNDTLGGTFRRIMSAAEGVQIAIGEALAPSFRFLEGALTGPLGMLAEFIDKNQWIVTIVAASVAGIAALGLAFVGIGTALATIGMALSGLGTLVGFLSAMAPLIVPLLAIAAVATAVGLLANHFGVLEGMKDGILGFFGVLGEIAGTTISGITAALQSGDWEAAGQIAMDGLKAAWAAGVAELVGIWEGFKLYLIEAFAGAVVAIQEMWTNMQNKISNAILEQASQEDWMGNLWSKILGVDMREENRRTASLNAQLGLTGPSATEQAQATVDAMTRDAQERFRTEGFGGDMMDMAATARQMAEERKAEADARAQAAKEAAEQSAADAEFNQTWKQAEEMFGELWGRGQEAAASMWDSWFGGTPATTQAAMQQFKPSGMVGGFDVRGIESGLAPKLLTETQKQTEILEDIRDSREGGLVLTN